MDVYSVSGDGGGHVCSDDDNDGTSCLLEGKLGRSFCHILISR